MLVLRGIRHRDHPEGIPPMRFPQATVMKLLQEHDG